MLTNFLFSSILKFDEYLSKSKKTVPARGPERRGLEVSDAPAFISKGRAQRRGGGAGRARTDDLRLAKAALPQLSYSPVIEGQGRWWA